MKGKHILTCIITLALIGCLVGCTEGESTQNAIDLAIVSGYHANSPIPAFRSTTVQTAIENCTATYGSVCLIVNDGSPHVVADYNISKPEKSLSSTKKVEVSQAQANQIISVLSGAKAITPEVDTLASIALAARSLEDAQGEKYIIIADSGLSTSGYLNFTQNLLRADSHTVIDYLVDTKALPALSDICITWVGLGDVAGNQDVLTPSGLETLKSIWSGVLYAAGARSVEFTADLPGVSTTESSSLPYVTPVPILQDTPLTIDVSNICFDAPLILGEEKILFLPDTSTFADCDAAMATLKPIADYMVSHPSFQILLAGTTATAGSNDDCKHLSKARAMAVKELLTSMGVDEHQVAATIGLGYDHKYHVPDIGVNGLQNENAPANRSVIIFDASSEAAVEMLSDELQ